MNIYLFELDKILENNKWETHVSVGEICFVDESGQFFYEGHSSIYALVQAYIDSESEFQEQPRL